MILPRISTRENFRYSSYSASKSPLSSLKCKLPFEFIGEKKIEYTSKYGAKDLLKLHRLLAKLYCLRHLPVGCLTCLLNRECRESRFCCPSAAMKGIIRPLRECICLGLCKSLFECVCVSAANVAVKALLRNATLSLRRLPNEFHFISFRFVRVSLSLEVEFKCPSQKLLKPKLHTSKPSRMD